MARNRRAKHRAAPKPGASPNAGPRRRWNGAVVLGMTGAVAAVVFLWTRPSPDVSPPAVETDGLEPEVAALVEKALGEVRSAPADAEAWGRLGMILHHYATRAEALACFDRAEALDGREARWPYWQSMLLQPVNADAALERLRRAAEIESSDAAEARLRLAEALFERGQWVEAGSQFAAVLERHAEHAPAWLGLARIAFRQERWQECEEHLRRCRDSPHAARAARELLATLRFQTGMAEAAAQLAREVKAMPPDAAWPDAYAGEALNLLTGRKTLADQAERLVQDGRSADAAPRVQRLIMGYPQEPAGWLLAGRLNMERGDCAGAETALRRHLALIPDSLNGWTQLGMTLLCLERYEEAVQVFERVTAMKPDFGEGWFNLGFGRARAGLVAGAIEAFRQAIRYSPEFTDAYITLADLLAQTGQRDEAVALLEQVLKIDPTDGRARELRSRFGL